MVSEGADLTGWPNDNDGGLASWITNRSRLKLSAVGDWKRRTTASSNAAFSYALRVCLASLSCPGPPDLAVPLASPLVASYAPDPGRAEAIKAGSMVDGDTVAEA